MSATYGPCLRCGGHTMYNDREPTPCWKCVVAEHGPNLRTYEWNYVEHDDVGEPSEEYECLIRREDAP